MSYESVLVTGDDVQSLLAGARKRLAGVHGRYNLGVLYVSDHLANDVEGLVEGLRLLTGVRHWAGGVALGVCGREGEVFDRPAMSLLLAALDEDCFRTFGPQRPPDADAELEAWRRAQAPYLGLVHADPRRAEVPDLLEGLSSGLGPFLVGGLMSSRGAYPHVAPETGEGALSGVLFTDRVPAVTRLSQGCSPIGARHEVTRVEENRLFSLDQRPVLEVLAEDLRAAGEPGGSLHIARIRRDSDTGDYLVRNILGVAQTDQTLLVGDVFSAGDQVLFCRRDAESAEADLRRMLDELRGSLPGPPRAGLYVSCLARGPNLFPEPELETRLIRERLGEFPLAGFFANGEVAGDRLYGYTGVLTLFC